MGTGLRLARQGGNTRGEIFALWRTGRKSRRGSMSSLAHQQLQQALNLSQESGVGEFELFIQLEMGRLFEDRGAWKRAERFYQAVVEAPDEARYCSTLYDTAKARDEAERRRVAARMHRKEAEVSRLYVILFGLAFVVALLGGAFAIHWRRTARLKRHFTVLRNGAPEEDNLFDRRRRYVYRVLERPAEVAIVLGEMDLSVLLVAGLEDRAQLYACVCALEEAIEAWVIDPKNMRRYLHHHFTKKGWDWPESVESWRKHFERHAL